MSNVIKLSDNFLFEGLSLGNTHGIQGGGYFSKLIFNDAPFVVQTPRCFTKNGIHKTGKKIYCDLKFSQLEREDSKFIEWLYKIEEKTRNLIFEHKDDWFHDAPTLEDIEYIWNSSVRTFQNDKNLHL